jgi:hypothetical protein
MFPITFGAGRLMDASGVEHRTAEIELPDVDAAAIDSFTTGGFPKLGPGDRVLIKSGTAGVYRRVVRVEPIAGGASLVWLDTGYMIRRERGQITI